MIKTQDDPPMTKRHLTIATRESPLAIQQAESVKTLLLMHHPNLSIDLLGITTEADRRLNVTLTDIGGKGLFVKELEEALYDGRADMAVHSMKDVPMELPPGLILPVMIKREEPRDAFVSLNYESLTQLPSGASLGTSSLRRQTQILAKRPDITLLPLRGNINTRLNRLDKGEFDAIVLAGAGLKRLQLVSRIRSYLAPEISLPAAGQGALGIECRTGDESTLALIAPLNDSLTFDCVSAERALCRRLGGGCKVPVAAFAKHTGNELHLFGLVANAKGTKILKSNRKDDRKHAESLGKRVAEELIEQGAEAILREFHD